VPAHKSELHKNESVWQHCCTVNEILFICWLIIIENESTLLIIITRLLDQKVQYSIHLCFSVRFLFLFKGFFFSDAFNLCIYATWQQTQLFFVMYRYCIYTCFAYALSSIFADSWFLISKLAITIAI
jgi:hypothetical protein